MKILKYIVNCILDLLSIFNTITPVQSDYWRSLDPEKREEIIKKIKTDTIKPIDLT